MPRLPRLLLRTLASTSAATAVLSGCVMLPPPPMHPPPPPPGASLHAMRMDGPPGAFPREHLPMPMSPEMCRGPADDPDGALGEPAQPARP